MTKKAVVQSILASRRSEALARFEQRLLALESDSVRGSQMWRLHTLLRTLNALPDDADAALKHLGDFDRKPSPEDIASISGLGTQKPSLGNMRVRLKKMKGDVGPS